MNRTILTIYINLAVINFQVAIADCVLEGRVYAEGTIIGEYVCEAGVWEKA